MNFLLVAVISLTWSAHVSCTCTSEMTTKNYVEDMETADVVFRGRPVGGKSSVGMTQDGKQWISGAVTFQVMQNFKDNTGDNSETIEVWRTFEEGDPCDQSPFPDMAPSYLVYAKANGNYLSVSTCGHSWPWNCVPDSVKDDLMTQ